MSDTVTGARLVAASYLSAARDTLCAVVNDPKASERDRLAAIVDVLAGAAADLWPLPEDFKAH